jgi:hypothetical protein
MSRFYSGSDFVIDTLKSLGVYSHKSLGVYSEQLDKAIAHIGSEIDSLVSQNNRLSTNLAITEGDYTDLKKRYEVLSKQTGFQADTMGVLYVKPPSKEIDPLPWDNDEPPDRFPNTRFHERIIQKSPWFVKQETGEINK